MVRERSTRTRPCRGLRARDWVPDRGGRSEDDTARRSANAGERRALGLPCEERRRRRTFASGDVAFSPDGTMLATQNPGAVRIWALGIDVLLETAERNVTRSLTDEECRQYLHVERCPSV